MIIESQKDVLFDYILENTQDIVSVINLDFDFLTCNRAFLKLIHKFHVSEVVNRNIKEIFPSECSQIIYEKLNLVLLYREPQTFTFKICINNEHKIIKQTSTPIIENCEITGILSVSRDITNEEDLKLKLVDKIYQLNRMIENENRLKEQKELFLATLTHDLKNPVLALLMTLKMLGEENFGNLNDEQKEIINTAIESSNYMKEMLHSIIATYKYENGLIEFNKEYFNSNELIKNCINEVKSLAKSKEIEIVFKNEYENIKIFADKTQMRRVVENIIINAINYACKNSKILIEIYSYGKNIAYSFTNTGDIIPEDLKKKIFEKYASTGKQLTNMGLGLYFSKKVIEAHDGKIYLKTNNNLNTFIFELPNINVSS